MRKLLIALLIIVLVPLPAMAQTDKHVSLGAEIGFRHFPSGGAGAAGAGAVSGAGPEGLDGATVRSPTAGMTAGAEFGVLTSGRAGAADAGSASMLAGTDAIISGR